MDENDRFDDTFNDLWDRSLHEYFNDIDTALDTGWVIDFVESIMNLQDMRDDPDYTGFDMAHVIQEFYDEWEDELEDVYLDWDEYDLSGEAA